MDYFSPEQLSTFLQPWAQSPWLILVVILVYIVGSVCLVPITVMILGSAYALTPLAGALCSIAGVILGGLAGLWIGRLIGKRRLEKISGPLLGKIKRRLSENQIISVAIIRKLPIAPFTIVNMALGALGVSSFHFALGSSLGLLPMIIIVALLDQSIETAIESGDTRILLAVGAGIIFTIGGALLFERVLRTKIDKAGQ